MQENIRRSTNRPQQALYTPGSGPLRKSDHGGDDESTMANKPVKNIAANRLTRIRQEEDIPSHNNKSEVVQYAGSNGDRRRNKKPEQPIFVPTPVAKARQESEKKHIETEPNRNERLDRNEKNFNGNNNNEWEKSNRRNKRYSNKRKGNEGHDEWRGNSPIRINRQGSEPRIQQNNTNNWPRTRDTRSVEPINNPPRGYQESRGPPSKPPSGRRHSTIGVEPEKRQKGPPKLDHLPPRFRKKRLDEGKFTCSNVPEEPWDGSSITFQCQSMGLPSNQHVTPNNMIYNTLPNVRPRGRGRIQNVINDYNAAMFRSITPDKFGLQSPVTSRPGTPNLTSTNRTRSSESLHRGDSRSQTPVNYSRNDDYRYNPKLYRRNEERFMDADAPYDSGYQNLHQPQLLMEQQQHHQQQQRQQEHQNVRKFDNREREQRADKRLSAKSYNRDRESNWARDSGKDLNLDIEQIRDFQGDDTDSLEAKMSSVTITAKEEHGLNADLISNDAFDWSEEVELHLGKNADEGLSDAMTRSSSVASLTESVSKNPPKSTHKSRKKRDRRNRRSGSHQREKSIENRTIVENYSPPRSQNQNRRRKNSHNSGEQHFKVPESRTRHRSSREQSFDRNRSRNDSRESSFDRHRRISGGDSEMVNWREEIRARTVEKEHSQIRNPPPTDENIRRGGIIHLPKEGPKPPVLNIKERPVMPETRRSPGQKTLFDPHNPSKPILVNKPNSRVSSSSFSESSDSPAGYVATDQLGNMRPAWHNETTDNFQSARCPTLLKDIRRVDAELQNYVNPQQILQFWMHIHSCRTFLKDSLLYLLREDMKFAECENIEQYFWKLLYYNFIEIMRNNIRLNPENAKQYKDFLLELIEEGTEYFNKLLEMLQSKYEFKLEHFTGVNAYSKSTGYVQLALVSAQKIYICLGDLLRYKEFVNETSNYGKCRQLYIKAHEINPKNGRPYNQLAVLAFCSRKKLDAVYYYMRSLMSTNPVPSAKEWLISLFDDNRKKYEHERKRREERLEKARQHMKEKESENTKTKQGSLRKETWIRPDGGRRVHRTTSTIQGSKSFDSEEEDLASLTSVEVNKRFVTSYLHVHGKLITKIGMETFHETALQMLKEFRALLQHSPVPLPSSRFLQLLALNMYAIESTKLKDPELQPGLRSEHQERALIVSLEMFSLILEKCVSILNEHLSTSPSNRNQLPQDAHELLPSVKIWCDWMLCHSRIWNPPPSTQDYKVGPSGDAWTRVAILMNLLEHLDQSIMTKFKDEPIIGYEQVRLPEDNTLSGFTPLLGNLMPNPTYVPPDTDIEAAQFALRLNRLLFFGTEFLCGIDPPVLKLEYRNDAREYVSVVCTTAGRSAPNTPPEFNESELLVESFSDEEDSSQANVVLENTSNEIQELLTRKSELERRQRDQELHRQTVEKILQRSVVSVHIEVKPKNLVPDTNCFIDYLPMLKTIAASNVYTLMVPLIVLNELEGLAKGAKTPERIMNAMHAIKVAEASKAALEYLSARAAGVKCITTKGTILTSTTFTKEDDAIVDVSATNDDRILATCMTLCKGNIEQSEGEPRRIQRDVVLLTEDRNLRVKALARDVPVREVPSFLQWAGLG